MSDKLREAAKAALEVLDILSKLGNGDVDGDNKGNLIAQDARQNLRAAIEADSSWLIKYSKAALAEPAIKESLTVAEPEQEPVACIKTNGELMWLKKPSTIYSKPRPLYTAPPRREWVGLTDEEINAIEFPQSGTATMRDFVRIIEAKLKEKNGG